jgi:hypothetical protein
MALFLYVLLPAAWAITGRLLGGAVALTVATEGGRRAGRAVGRHTVWLFPGLCLALLLAGASGNAGRGVRLFGSEELMGVLCLPVYAIPVLGGYALLAYVIRDLTGRGQRSQPSDP